MPRARQRRPVARTAALLLLVAHVSRAEEWKAEFIYPAAKGVVMHNMDVMEVSYKSNYPNASLWAFCYNGKIANENLVIMGVYKNAQPFDGSQLFQFDNDFASDTCWYNLRNLEDDEKGINGINFSYDWKKRDAPTTLNSDSPPEATEEPEPSSKPADAAPTEPSKIEPSKTTQSDTEAIPSNTSNTNSLLPTERTSRGPDDAPGTSAGSSFTGTASSTTIQTPLIPLNTSAAENGSSQDNTGTGSSDRGSTLSSGVIAGIVVGCVLGVLGLVAFVGALWLVRRRRTETSRMSVGKGKCNSKGGFGFIGRAELEAKPPPQELDARVSIQELPG